MRRTLLTADRIFTQDTTNSIVEALVIDGDRVLAGGTRKDMADRAGPGIRHLDLPGATVIPGLIESHIHPTYAGLTDGWADCRTPPCSSIVDIQRALRGVAPSAGWIRGWGYDDTQVRECRHLTRDDLDAVSTVRPVIVLHISGHFAVANTVALATAGIDESTVDPGDPQFPRTADGRLTGMAWEIDAVARLSAAIPNITDAEVRAALLRSLELARSRGITTVHDLGVGLSAGMQELAAYRALDNNRELPVHTVGFLRGDLTTDALDNGGIGFAATASPGSRFRLAGAKFWADGSIQGLSAALRAPYTCSPDHHGDLLYPQEQLDAMVLRVHRAGGQVAVHANGDAAVGAAISALRSAQASDGRRARHRIEHCQVTDSTDLAAIRKAELGVSFFVNHVLHWGDRHRDRFLGPERAADLDPLACAAALGLRFGLHSDCPITPMDPLQTIRTAVTRLTKGGSVLGADQRIGVHRAIQAMTTDSAYLVHDEHQAGTLAPGQRADLVALDGDLTALADGAAEIPRPALVMIDGRWAA
ncbi:amidohydrolase [Antrihabitans sp. YC3-6]|uniref:Amidohydrolase n=1 Tax=Antrihabitans stalagmiti TaxID=2799499 RepID=A0A934U5Z0_9NOCA|nr:amidohydrolase [Antrihabitans stalagmiti]MBJ8341956.1 amidohydrolase [Antrihabitans stalagmiti]